MRNVLYPKKKARYANLYQGPLDRSKLVVPAAQSTPIVEAVPIPEPSEPSLPDMLTFYGKLKADNQIFGSVTASDIAEKLRTSFNINIDKNRIRIPTKLNEIKEQVVWIKLAGGQEVKLAIKIEQH